MLNELTIVQAHQGLLEKKFSTLELIQDCFKQIKKENKKINAFITLCEENALEQTKKVDKKIAQNEKIKILEGIPFSVKDSICTQGIRTTCASKMLENFIPPYDATVIKKLKENGAIILGKTNLDEFSMGSSTENSYFGPTKNPCDLERVPGGTSGGSAATVASQMCIASLGADMGGSIRQPAAFCGIVGFKPTYGQVSRFGLITSAPSLDQIGPMTKTIEDAEIVFQAIKGKDPFDSTSAEFQITNSIRQLADQIPNKSKIQNQKSKIKIGIPKEYFIEGLDQEVKKSIENEIKRLEKKEIEFIEVNLPHTQYALACYYLIMMSEASANLERYDGIRYSRWQVVDSRWQTLSDVYFKTRAQGFGNEVKRRIMLGTYALSKGYYDQYYLKAQKIRALIKKDFDQAFEKVNFLIAPTTPTPAFKLNEKTQDPLQMYLSDIFTVPVNLAGLPAISIPVKNACSNLPIGFQIIGKQFEDERMLEFGKIIEKSNYES